jgi:hypothetical protein
VLGLAVQAHAQIVVRDAPIHPIPADADDADDAGPAPDQPNADAVPPPMPQKAEPAPVRALVQPKAPPPAPALTPEEAAFFAALGQRVTDAASAYESYVRRAGAIDPAFSGAAGVQKAVKAGAAYKPEQLEEGIVAYAALIALRNPTFVDGVRAITNPAFGDGLAADPGRVMRVRGAEDAAADAAGVLRAQGEALVAAGRTITKAAYDIQAQAWSKTPVADPKGVLDAAKTSGQQMRAATTPSKEKLLASLVAAPQPTGAAAAPAPDVVRGLALAALAILGKTGDGAEPQFEALLRDPAAEDCLKMAKLDLNQCLSVAGPHYEDAYCAGRHGIADTGKCVAAAAGPASDTAATPVQPRLQEAEGVGPEQAATYGQAVTAPADDEDEDDTARPVPAGPAASPPRYAAETAPVQPVQAQQVAPQAAPTPPAAQAYARNDYAPPAAAPQAYGYPQQPYPQQQYAPQYPPQYAQAYPQQAYPQQAYPQPAHRQPYPQPPQAYAQPSYGQQPYYPQAYGYYGR